MRGVKEKCDCCEHFRSIEKINPNPKWGRIFYECEKDETYIIAIRKLGRINGPDEPWDPVPEIKTLLDHECIPAEQREAGLKWIRIPSNNHKLQKTLRSLRIKIDEAGGLPVLRPEWCPKKGERIR